MPVGFPRSLVWIPSLLLRISSLRVWLVLVVLLLVLWIPMVWLQLQLVMLRLIVVNMIICIVSLWCECLQSDTISLLCCNPCALNQDTTSPSTQRGGDEIVKKQRRQFRELCTHKPGTGRLEVTDDMHQQYLAGGSERETLFGVFVDSAGNKAWCVSVLLSLEL